MQWTVDCAKPAGSIDRFWRATGFTPATWMDEPAMKQAITYLGSIPNDGVRHVRIHHLLDLVRVKDLDSNTPKYDWSRLDDAIDHLVDNDLAPFFELMGNPSGQFDDFTDPTQISAWRDLIGELSTHLVERYGRDEVESWYFETWNEPDIGFGWTQFEYDSQAFLKYYDACDAGLQDAPGEFVFGGPGTSGQPVPATEMEVFRSLMEHCDSGTNHLTGERPNIDFISVHEKGAPDHEEEISPDSWGITERELAVVEYLEENHPDLAELPLSNNECDPQTGWNTTHTWRAQPYYAGFVAKVIAQHIHQFHDKGRNYGILSNDNGFLGGWGKRSHFAQFGSDETHIGEFDLIKKPVHNVMTALSFLGSNQVGIDGPSEDHFTIIATKEPGQIAILLTNCRDKPGSGEKQSVTLRVENLPFDTGALVEYRIDEDHANPFAIWEAEIAPTQPDSKAFESMRAAQEVAPMDPPQDVAGDHEISLALPHGGVSLLHIASKSEEAPPAPTDLTAQSHRGTVYGESNLLSWSDCDQQTIATYEILKRAASDDEFERINENDQIATAWIDPNAESTNTDQYAIRAVDYWGRKSELSSYVEI